MSSQAVPRLAAAERRQQILDVARAEFVSAGYEGARLQRIAAAVGVTDALIYKHFVSKRELFEEAVVTPLHQIAEQFEAIMELPVDAAGVPQREATYRYTRALLGVLSETIELLGVVLFGEQVGGAQFYVEHVRPVIDAAIAGVKENLPRWDHREFDPQIATEAFFGMCLGIALDRSMRQVPLDLDRCASELTAMLFDGTAAH